MPPQNFMAVDFLAVLEGFCLFSLIAFLPGYAIGWLTDVLGFRSRALPFRLAFSTPLSIAVGPVLSYTIGRWFSLNAVWGVYAVLGAYTLYRFALIARTPPERLFARFRVFFGLIAAWISLAVLSLSDMQIGRKLYFSIIGFDYAIRTAFTQAIGAYGLPARNPFFFPGSAIALRYHYFWLIQCGLVTHAAGAFVDARQALISGTIWCGIALICLIPAYLRVFNGQTGQALRRQSLIGILLLAVTGLDIFPALTMVVLNKVGWVQSISPSVEWWNDQVDGWLYTMLWEPHYLCAVVACFTGFLVLWEVGQSSSWRSCLASAAVAGAAFSSAAGSGIYVALVFAVFLAIWTLLAIVRNWRRHAAAMVLSGAVAAALSRPYLHTLSGSSGVSAGPLFQFTIRSFYPGEMFMRAIHLDRLWQFLLGDALALPLNYFLELGFFFAAGLIAWRGFRKWRSPLTRTTLAGFLLITVSITMCTFMQSGVISNNDLGWRGFLIAQFALLLWGSEVLSVFRTFSRKRRIALGFLLVAGVAGTSYDLAILRFFPVLSDGGQVPKIGWLAADEKLGLRTYANREAYTWLRSRTSTEALIQQNPGVVYQDSFFGLYGQRQTVAYDTSCGATFGGDVEKCKPLSELLQQIYTKAPPASLETACRAAGVDFFVARDTDPAWLNRESWVWRQQPVFQNSFVRLFTCGSQRVHS